MCMLFLALRRQPHPLRINSRRLPPLDLDDVGIRHDLRISLANHGALSILTDSLLIVLLQQAFILIAQQ